MPQLLQPLLALLRSEAVEAVALQGSLWRLSDHCSVSADLAQPVSDALLVRALWFGVASSLHTHAGATVLCSVSEALERAAELVLEGCEGMVPALVRCAEARC
jgi:hypothetical protein